MILGTISGYEEGVGLRITIDGEETPTIKSYKFLSSYNPAVNDRVLIEEISGSYVVLGKVTDITGAFDGIGLTTNSQGNVINLVDSSGNTLSSVTVDRVGRLQAYSYDGYIQFTYFNNNLWVRVDGDNQFALAKV